jgi:hypothetical protein
MKIQSTGQRFEDITEIQAELLVVLNSIVKQEFQSCFQL